MLSLGAGIPLLLSQVWSSQPVPVFVFAGLGAAAYGIAALKQGVIRL